ncbi:MAG: hypothetical protein OHK0028_23640 [Deltaproteobacteria bacterium]
MIDLRPFNAGFFNGTFDEEGVFTPFVGSPRSIRVIFDNEYQAAQFAQADAAIESSGPRATCREGDVPGVAHGDTLQVRGLTYSVAEVHPDGAGLVVLILSKDV